MNFGVAVEAALVFVAALLHGMDTLVSIVHAPFVLLYKVSLS